MKKQLLTGAFLLAAFFSAKAQNSCADALTLSTGTTTVGEIDGEFLESCWTNNPGEAGEWYKITATDNGAYRINTNLAANAGGDTRVSVFSGDSCDELECWWSADDVYYAEDEDGNPLPGVNYLTDFQFPVVAGETYYIQFDDVWSSEGFDVQVEWLPSECDNATSLSEDWSNVSNFYFCWSSIDGNDDDNTWTQFVDYNFDSEDINADNVVAIFSGADGNNDILASPGKNLVSGTEYTVNVVYNGIDAQDQQGNLMPADESFSVVMFDSEGNAVEEIGAEEGVVMSGEAFNELKGNATTGSYTFTPEESGVYFFGIVSTSAGGTGALLIFEINVEGTMGTEVLVDSNFAVYPNPANSLVNVTSTNDIINNVTLADVNGRTIKTVNIASNNGQINVSDLANGVYMMTISSDKGSVTKKIVKN